MYQKRAIFEPLSLHIGASPFGAEGYRHDHRPPLTSRGAGRCRMVQVARTPEPDQEGTTRRNVLKGGAPAVGAFIAFDAIGGISLAAGTSPKATQLANGVIFPDPTLCIGCLTCEVICSQVHKQQGLSDLPHIRVFNDPTTNVDPAVQAQYPGRGQFHQEPCLQSPIAECLYVCR